MPGYLVALPSTHGGMPGGMHTNAYLRMFHMNLCCHVCRGLGLPMGITGMRCAAMLYIYQPVSLQAEEHSARLSRWAGCAF